MELDLKQIRKQLDGIDDQLIGLFTQRMNLASQVAEYKRQTGMPILDSGREREIINRVSKMAGEDFEHYAKLLYQTLFSVSRAYQGKKLRPNDPLMDTLEKAAAQADAKIPGRATVACQGREGA